MALLGVSLLLCSLGAAAVRADADNAGSTVSNPYEGEAARAAQGRDLFNQYCAHCHAPNAVSPDPPRNLRRLRARYGEHMAEVFHTTVTNGRPDKGMPVWGGQLSEEVLWTIFTFLESVQDQP